MFDFSDVSTSFFAPKPPPDPAQDADEADELPVPGETAKPTRSRGHKTLNRDLFRRFTSERAVEECVDWEWREGEAYHVVTWGDIDALTFLKMAVRQARLEHVWLSTWCMAQQDVEEIRRWWEMGRIGRIDFFVGEIFRASYATVYAEIERFCREEGGRVAMFRNHSKVIAFRGDTLSGAIEGSANVNTNPRMEQFTITIDAGLADFYAEVFDGIKSFDKGWNDVDR